MKILGVVLYIIAGLALIGFAVLSSNLRGYVPQDPWITKIALPIGISGLLGIGLIARGIIVLVKKK